MLQLYRVTAEMKPGMIFCISLLFPECQPFLSLVGDSISATKENIDDKRCTLISVLSLKTEDVKVPALCPNLFDKIHTTIKWYLADKIVDICRDACLQTDQEHTITKTCLYNFDPL